MGTPTIANILKSKAVVWYAPYGESEPDETTVQYGDDWGGNWARIGYTKEPLKMAIDDQRMLINVEEELMPVDERRIGFDMTFETVLAEVTAAYMALLAEGTVSTTAAAASQVGYEELEFGNTPTLTKRAWGFEGLYTDSSGTNFPVRVFIQRGTAKFNGDLEWSQKTDDYVGIPMQVHTLGIVGGQPVKFQRVTAEATSGISISPSASVSPSSSVSPSPSA